MSTLAIIPARSGSKGIPGKNTRLIAGKPLMVWTIEAALRARGVDRVLVSTDDAGYAALARENGAEAPFLRPAALATDTAGSEAALLHALDVLQTTEGRVPERLVFLQCTSPLTLPEDIEGCLKLVGPAKADTAFTVTATHGFLWRFGQDGNAEGINHKKAVRMRRQDREPEFRETGAVYVMKTSGFREAGHRFFGRTAMYEVPAERSWEIDSMEDWVYCEWLLRRRLGEARKAVLPPGMKALVMDFDGVLTDNRVWVDQNGVESVACWRSDGLRLEELRRQRPDLKLLILSREQNPVVARRAEKLGLDVLHGIQEKALVLEKWLMDQACSWDDVVFIGNDLNDVSCLRRAGCGVAPADAYPEAVAVADLVLSRSGGHGALRELIDLMLTGENAQ